jgi:hypothetical protein
MTPPRPLTTVLDPGAGALRKGAERADVGVLRALVVVAGLCWAVSFVVLGLGYGLQMYADGSIFSYSIAVQDAWAFHWSNISGRLFVYLFAFVPAETYVGLTGDARGGILVYGLLQFTAPLLGLAATYLADRSQGRILFVTACASTALLCPLVFGFPTELWMGHAVFWPALAVCHYARRGLGGTILVSAALLMLVLTHEGAVVFALAILATTALRGLRDPAFLRTAGALAVALAIWATVKIALPPDDYFGSVVVPAAMTLVDPMNFTADLFLLLLAAAFGYGIVFLLLWRLSPIAHIHAAATIAVALAVYWLWFDQSLHADDRYLLRTALLIGTPAFGMLATLFSLWAEGRLALPVPLLPQIMPALSSTAAVRTAIGLVTIVMLVHCVETAKFVTAWSAYKVAVRALATGNASDPALGDPRFVSSARINPKLDRLSWFSTTPYLSVLVAPGFAPARLVVDPEADYFWLSCETATENLASPSAVPLETRRVIRDYSCLHR